MTSISILLIAFLAVTSVWGATRLFSRTSRLRLAERNATRALHKVEFEILDIDGRLGTLRQQQIDSWPVEQVIAHASLQERKNLASILDHDPDAQPPVIVNRLRELGSHSIAAAWRVLSGRGWKNRHVEYDEVFVDVATQIGIKTAFSSRYEAEKALVTRAFNATLDSLPEQDRDALLVGIHKELASRGLLDELKGPALGAVVIAGAQASGFGIYLMATTLVGGISSAIGVVLPFAVYTGLTKVISLAIGPLGIAAVGALAIHQMAAPNLKRTLPAIILVCSIRSRLLFEASHAAGELHAARATFESRRRYLERRIAKLAALRSAR